MYNKIVNDEKKKELFNKFQELYNFHDQKILNQMKHFHHPDIISFIDWVRQSVEHKDNS